MKRWLSAGTALALLLSTPLAFAQQDQHAHPQDQHMSGPQHAGPDHMAPNHVAPDHPTYAINHGEAPFFGGGGQKWHDGDHYHGERHAVDWRGRHLRQPPHGYEWVQDGNNYVLIAVTSGVIASIVANAVNQ